MKLWTTAVWGKDGKIQRQEKAICQNKGKVQELCLRFVGNTALCSPPKGTSMTVSLLWNNILYSEMSEGDSGDIKIRWRTMYCVWYSILCYLIPHVYCLFSLNVCVCVHVCVYTRPWKALKWAALDRFLFVFSAQDQSQVALKLARRGFALYVTAE